MGGARAYLKKAAVRAIRNPDTVTLLTDLNSPASS
jgi:hypothetical protein